MQTQRKSGDLCVALAALFRVAPEPEARYTALPVEAPDVDCDTFICKPSPPATEQTRPREQQSSKATDQTPWEYFVYALKYGFTTYNSLALTALIFLVDAPHARAVFSCTTVGIAASFSSAYFLEPASFARIAVRLGISLPAFHLAKFVVHLLPVAVVLAWATAPISLVHALAAALLHVGWGLCISFYVPLPQQMWLSLLSIAVVVELLAMPAVEHSTGAALWESAPLGYAYARK